jgi:hypothetical protein
MTIKTTKTTPSKATKTTTASKATASKASKASAKQATQAREQATREAEALIALESVERHKPGQGPARFPGVMAENGLSQLAPSKPFGELEIKILSLIHNGKIKQDKAYTKPELKRLFQDHAGYATERSSNAGVDRVSPPRSNVMLKNEAGLYVVNSDKYKKFVADVLPEIVALRKK